jgi:hypothetical protein
MKFGLAWLFGNDATGPAHTVVNPATALPMIDDEIGGIDVAGNPFGTDLHSHDAFETHASFDAFGHDAIDLHSNDFFNASSPFDSFGHDSTSMFDHDIGFGSNPWD